MSPAAFTKTITCPRPNPAARLRLFCLPFAGGGASAYRLWSAGLPSWIEVCPIQPPGREDRYREPPFTSLTALARLLARELAPYLDKPFVIFGHSMGALVAFEIARALRQSQMPAPLALLPAAYPAPHLPLARAPIHHLPDADFIEEMRRMQGTPAAVLENRELMDFVLPILRADFQACDTYVCAPERPLDCPFVAYGGTDDGEVTEPALEQWRAQTCAAFERRMFPGTHFFVQAHRELLLADITARLTALTAQPARIMSAW
jgi:medium-chain acyl-[acyl-carrier-protein] hydrolase